MDGKHSMPDPGPDGQSKLGDALPATVLVYVRTGFQPAELICTRHDGTQRPARTDSES